MADDGKVLRRCKLASCGVTFKPRRKDHYFHDPSCKQSFFTQARAVGVALAERLGRFPTDEEVEGMVQEAILGCHTMKEREEEANVKA